MIEATKDELPPSPHEGAANHAFVILGRSSREAACVDPRIHAVTSARISVRQATAAGVPSGQGATFSTVAERRGNGMDPRVCAASLRSLLRPRMTKVWLVTPSTHAASRLLSPGMTKARSSSHYAECVPVWRGHLNG